MVRLPFLFLLLSACHGAPDDAQPGPAVGDTDPGPGGTDSGDTDVADDPGDTGSGDTDAGASDSGDSGTGDSGTGEPGADDSGTADPCVGRALCDGFEDVAAGGPPDAATWALTFPDCSGAGTLSVDDTIAHAGTHSVRVDGGGGYCDHAFMRNTTVPAAVGAPLYGRFFVRFAAPLGDSHVTFLAFTDTQDGGHPLRMGGQSGIFMWNRASDDATLPVLSPAGIATSLSPAADQWFCVEVMVDGPAGLLTTWVDGEAVPGLAVDGTPTAEMDAAWLGGGGWNPAPADLAFGWESYAGQSMTLWFDDVAFAGTRIGCGA